MGRMKDVRALITQEAANIECNFDQVKEAIESTLEEYRGAVFTEDSKAIAKKHVASLRAQKKAFQDNLRTEKKRYMEPWERFEKQAKELIGLYDKPIDLINGQVQAFEQERISRKKASISIIYNNAVPTGLRGYIPESRIYNSKWENATFSEKKIIEEIAGVAKKTEGDIEAIKAIESEATEKALQIYQKSLDVMEAIVFVNNYERQKQEVLAKEREKVRREEEERVRREEREKVLAEQKAKEEREAAARRAEEEKAAAVKRAKEEAALEVMKILTPDEGGDSELYEYRIFLTPDEKDKLETYMNSVGIEWEMI